MKTFLLILLICSSTQASTLQSAVDEYQYALTVEWDQHDHEFLNASKEKFRNKISSSEITPAEIIEFTKSQIMDRQMREDLQAIHTSLHSGHLSMDEAQNFMLQSLARSNSKGAAWMGAGNYRYWIGMAFVLVNVIWLLESGDLF